MASLVVGWSKGAKELPESLLANLPVTYYTFYSLVRWTGEDWLPLGGLLALPVAAVVDVKLLGVVVVPVGTY